MEVVLLVEARKVEDVFCIENLNEYPFLISYTIAEMEKSRAEKDVRGEFEFLIASYIQIVRYVGCILVADYLEKGEEFQEKKLNRLLDQLRRPTLGTWKEAVTLSLLTYHKHKWEFDIKGANQLKDRLKSLKYDGCQYESFETTSTKSLGVLEALLELRKIVAHGGSVPDAALCKSLIEFYRPMLKDLLEAVDFVKEFRLFRVLDAEGGQVLFLHGVHTEGKAPAFTVETIEDEDILWEIEENEIYLLTNNADKPVLRLNPIFLYIRDDEMTEVREQPADFLEPVFTFEGYESKKIAYLGVKVKTRRKNEYFELTQKFKLKGVDSTIKKENLYPWTLQAIAKDSSEEEISRLLNVKYFPNFYTSRKQVESYLDQFLDSMYSGFILSGESGVGKSSLLCFKAQQWLGANKAESDFEVFENRHYHIVLYINSASLMVSDTVRYPVLEKVKNALSLDPTINSVEELLYHMDLHRKNDGFADRKFILVLDAINESMDTLSVLQELNEWIVKGRQEKYSWLKIVFSIRTTTLEIIKKKLMDHGALNSINLNSLYYFPNPNKKDEVTGEAEVVWGLDRFTEKEFEMAYERRKQSNAPTPRAEYQDIKGYYRTLSHPLLLDMLCKVFDNKPLPKQLTELSLFQRYHHHTFAMNPDLEVALNKVVETFYSKSRSFIYYENILSIIEAWEQNRRGIAGIIYLNPYEKLLDEGVFYEGIEYNAAHTEKKTLIRFTHQKYFEFLLADYLKRMLPRPITLDAIKDQFAKMKGFSELFEAVRSLIVLEVSDGNWLLWGQLLSQLQEIEYSGDLLSEVLYHLSHENPHVLDQLIPSTLAHDLDGGVHSMLMTAFDKMWNSGNGSLSIAYIELLIQEVTQDSDEWVRTALSLCQKLSVTGGRLYDSIELLKQVEAARSQDQAIMTEVYKIRGKVYAMLSQWNQAFDSFRKLESVTSNDPVTLVMALVNNQLRHNLYRADAAVMERALDIIRSNKKLFPYEGAMHEGRILGNIGAIYIHHGRFKEGENLLQQSRQIFEDLGLQIDLVLALNNIGYAQIRSGEFKKARETLHHSIKVAEQSDDEWGKLALKFNYGSILVAQGSTEEALELYQVLKEQYVQYAEHPSRSAELAGLICRVIMEPRGIVEMKSEILELKDYFRKLDVQYPELFILTLLEGYAGHMKDPLLLEEAKGYLVQSEEVFNSPCLDSFNSFYGLERTGEQKGETPLLELENGLTLPLYLKIRFWEV